YKTVLRPTNSSLDWAFGVSLPGTFTTAMLFRSLGQVVRWGWPVLLAGWVALLLATRHAAPPWEQVAQDREFAFLPANAPSRQAEEVYARAFPTAPLASNIVLVLYRAGNEQPHLKADLAFI